MTEKAPLYLDCIHCGLCLSSCPTYRVLGSEMDSPRGRIYLMRAYDEGRAKITDSFVEHMFRCLDCRACETACPSGVHFGHMMEEMRGKIIEDRSAHWIARLMLNHVFPHPWRFHLASRMLQLYRASGMQAVVRATGILKLIAPRMAAAEALMPEIGIETGVPLGGTYPAEGQKQGTVAFFAGCVMNSMMGSINRSSVRLLTAAGYDVIVPREQICCGALANHAGLRETAREMARNNIAAFPVDKLDAIIINAAGCGAMLKEYPLLGDDITGAREFSSKVKDITEFLVSTRIFERLRVPLDRRVGYDDPCHLIHGQGVKSEPRRLLKAIPGIHFVEVEGADQCCGSAGIYNITQNELSMEILDRKMEKIQKAGIDVLATGNPGCMFQFRYGAKKFGMKLEVAHPVELLARSLGDSQ
ncbi:MAG TPA: (Fe-S)-binding protein [Terriglobia bacterium]|nr:(Fe-S)-binding protein [Terriglobia bacterium]